MNCFIAFTFNRYKKDLPDGFTESCQGRVIVEGIPESTQKLDAVENKILGGLRKMEPAYEFTKPVITAVTPLPDDKRIFSRT